MKNIHIFRLAQTMIANVAELERQLWKKPWLLKDIASLLSKRKTASIHWDGLIATHDNKIIGYELFVINKKKRDLEIMRIGVDKKYQRQGVATALLSKTRHLFKSNNKILCTISEHNLAAQLLFQHNSFMYISTSKKFSQYEYNNKTEDEDGYLFEYYLETEL